MTTYENFEIEPFAGCENPDVPMGKWLLEKMPVRPTKILDVGCGTGLHTHWFNEVQKIPTFGITINLAEVAAKRHENVHYGDMCKIPASNGYFDCVFCLGSLEHTFSPFIALCEFNRVLKPGGWLFFDMPNIYNMEIMDPGYWYHKSILFPIQVRDLLIKSQFNLEVFEGSEEIKGVRYSADSAAVYLAQKMDAPIRWLQNA